MADQPTNQASNKLLDLSSPERSVRLKFSGRTGLHFFRHLALDDWMHYVQGLRSEIVGDGDTWETKDQAREVAEQLWNDAIRRVEGYKLGETEGAPSWKERMPLSHKLAAVALLQEVYARESGDPFDLEPDTRLITLEAAWNLEVYEGLQHRFRVPTRREDHDYRRLNVQYYRQRGSRQPRQCIRIVPRLRQLCGLYDRLVLDVAGYTGADAPQKEMDPLHKQAAVVALFEPLEIEPEEEKQVA